MRIIEREFEFIGVSTCRATIKAVIEFDLNEIKKLAESAVEIKAKPKVDANAVPTPVKNNEKLSEVLHGAVEWNGHYYKIFPMLMGWENAKKFCESVGGHLAVPETHAENEMMKKLFLDYNKEVKVIRIGGYREDNGLWKWLTDKWLANYFDWGEGQPRSDSTLIFSRELGGKWATRNSHNVYCFMCEWESAADAHDSAL